jgi:thioredoxin reductase (NADPH)
MAAVLEHTLKDLTIEALPEEIIKIEKDKDSVNLYSPTVQYNAQAVIIATGASFKKLGVTGEDEFTGRGVSYCALCDGFFFRGKDVAVVGGGNSALEEALYLSGLCRSVTLIHRRQELRALQYLQEELFKKKNVKVFFNTVVKEIKGKDSVEELVLEDVLAGKMSSVRLNALFVAIGVIPNTEILKDILTCDEHGFIITDEEMKTSCDFIWSAGDCRKRPLRQLITAASEGAIAAVSAYKYLKGRYISS